MSPPPRARIGIAASIRFRYTPSGDRIATDHIETQYIIPITALYMIISTIVLGREICVASSTPPANATNLQNQGHSGLTSAAVPVPASWPSALKFKGRLTKQ